MRALVMKRIGEVGFVDKEELPEPGPSDAVIQTRAALVCTSDVHTVDGGVFAEYFHVNAAEANLAPIPDENARDLRRFVAD